MNQKTQEAILLALEALLNQGNRSRTSKAALEALNNALESMGYRARPFQSDM